MKICPDGVGLCLISVVFDLEGVMSRLPGFAAQDDVVLRKWLLSNTFELILIFLFGGLILQSQEASGLANPLGRKSKLEIVTHSLLDKHLTSQQRESTAF